MKRFISLLIACSVLNGSKAQITIQKDPAIEKMINTVNPILKEGLERRANG
jgi:hypothetical protein